MASPATSSGLFKFLRPRLRPQSTDVVSAATWGVFATASAVWLVQPFDWLKQLLFEKPEE